jgi:hypothetical protein
MISVLSSLIPHSITFDYLWALLPPNCLVVGKSSLDFDSIWCVREHDVQKMEDGTSLVMQDECIVWDGVKVGNVIQGLRIPIFTGVKLIGDLPYIPLKYDFRRRAVMKRVLERSTKALKF